MLHSEAWRNIEFTHEPHNYDGQQHKVPVVEQFSAENASQVTLVAKLAEDRAGGASTCVLKIDGVH